MSSTNRSNKINQFKDAYQNSKEGYAFFKKPSGSLKNLLKTHGIETAPPDAFAALTGLGGGRDQDIWAQAAELVFDLYEWDGHEADKRHIEQKIHEKVAERSIPNPLWYLADDNQEDISNLMRASDSVSIKDACKLWVRQEIEKAANILNEWVNEQA